MLVYEARSSAPVEDVWALMSRPDRWSEWAPHVRGATGLGSPEVVEGASGVAWLAGLLPVPARVLDKRPGRSWRWRVGLVEIDHRAEPTPWGSRVILRIEAPAPIERLMSITYGPLVQLLLGNLARVASRQA